MPCTSPSVSDCAITACFEEVLAEAGPRVMASAENTLPDVSSLTARNRSREFNVEALPKHSNLPTAEKTIQLGYGGTWAPGGKTLMKGRKNAQMYTYTQNIVVDVQFLGMHKRAVAHFR